MLTVLPPPSLNEIRPLSLTEIVPGADTSNMPASRFDADGQRRTDEAGSVALG